MPRKKPDLELEINRDRFPFEIRWHGEVVCRVYIAGLVDIFSDAVQHASELNRLRAERNKFLLALRGETEVDPRMYKLLPRTKTSGVLTTQDLERLHGVKLGQIWSTKKYKYRITDLDGVKQSVSLEWVDDPSYKNTTSIKNLKSRYKLTGGK